MNNFHENKKASTMQDKPLRLSPLDVLFNASLLKMRYGIAQILEKEADETSN